MSRNKKGNFFWYFSQFIIKNLIPLITLPIFTRFISLEDFGIYALVIFYATFISGISNLGLLSIFDRSFFELNAYERKSLLFTILIFVSSLFLVFLCFTNILNEKISETLFNKNQIKNHLMLALCFQGIKSFNQYFLSYFKNYDNAKNHTYISILETFLSIGLALFLVTYLSMGLNGFILGQFLGVSIVFILIFILLFFPFKIKFDFFLLKEQLKLSLPLTPRIFFGVINNQFDRYMLGLLGSLGGVGLYDIGQKIANTTFIFMTSLENVYSPEVYRRLFSKNIIVKNSVSSFLTPFFYISISLCLLVGLFSYEILFVLTAKNFHSAAPIISILCLLYGFYFFGKQPQLLYAKKTSLISLLSLITILLNIGINIPMIKYYGAIGAAWATLIAGLISTSISFYFGQKYTPIRYDKKYFNLLAYYVISILTIVFLNHFEFNYFVTLVIKFLLSFIYLIYGIRLKIITKEKINTFLKRNDSY